MAILFVSNLVPDNKPYNGLGFARSANNVLIGIADALPKEEKTKLISCRPIASFPKGPLWIKKETVTLDSGRELLILPVLNLKVIKNIFWGFCLKKIIKKWARENVDRKVLVYNIYTPPISQLYKICKKTKSKLFAILYDLGVPPSTLKLNWITRWGYKAMEKKAYKYIPRLNGRIVINETIIKEYAPDKDFLLIDGGVNNNIINRLFPLTERSQNSPLVLTLAGMLWNQNGTKLVLDCLSRNPDLNIIVNFAGNGQDVEKIKEAAKTDSRIHYLGLLDPKELFNLYAKSDVLLNLRIEEKNDMHFPSKLLEYIATGKHVISTPIAHAERDYGDFITVLPEISSESLCYVIKQLLKIDSKVLLNKGLKARQFMIENRNWEVRTKQILEYIND